MAREERGATIHNSKDEWFEPVSAVVDSLDCPGGVCPVPWGPWTTKEKPPAIQGDVVNHPPHYTDGGGVECIEAIEAQLTVEEYKGYLRGNCVKYLWRCNRKGNSKEDLQKCEWYLNRLLQLDEAQNG